MTAKYRILIGLLGTQLGLCGCLAAVESARAQSPGSPTKSNSLKSKVTSVAIFKNGTALFVRETRLKGAGWHSTEPPPAAVLGSLWLTAKGADVNRLLARRFLSRKTRPCRSFHEVLDANPGLAVRLYLKNKLVVEGTLVRVKRPVQPKLPGAAFSPGYVTLKTRNGYATVPRLQILRAEYKSLPQRMCYDRVHKHRLFFHAKRARPGAVLRYLYVQRGMQWTPTYRLVLGRARGKLTMQAVVVNRKEPIAHTQLKLVVGVPNIVNQHLLSPMALGALKGQHYSRRQRHGAYDNYRAQRFSNVRRSTRANGGGDRDGGRGRGRGTTIFGRGAKAGNLYVYNVGRVSLKKNERTIVPVMKGTFPVKKLYRWEPGPAKKKEAWHRRRFRSVTVQIRDRVWEYIQLRNKSRMPLTTGPVLIMKAGQVLAQDVLRYTPPGGKSEIPVNVAANILSSQVKSETSRRNRAKKIRYRWYTQVKYRVDLKIVNHERRAVRITIRKRITGRVISAPGAKLRKTGKGGAINPTSLLSYDVKVPAGKTWTAQFNVNAYE